MLKVQAVLHKTNVRGIESRSSNDTHSFFMVQAAGAYSRLFVSPVGWRSDRIFSSTTVGKRGDGHRYTARETGSVVPSRVSLLHIAHTQG